MNRTARLEQRPPPGAQNAAINAKMVQTDRAANVYTLFSYIRTYVRTYIHAGRQVGRQADGQAGRDL